MALPQCHRPWHGHRYSVAHEWPLHSRLIAGATTKWGAARNVSERVQVRMSVSDRRLEHLRCSTWHELRRSDLDKTDKRRRINSEADQDQREHGERRSTRLRECTRIRARAFGNRRTNRDDDSQIVE